MRKLISLEQRHIWGELHPGKYTLNLLRLSLILMGITENQPADATKTEAQNQLDAEYTFLRDID